MIVDAASPLVEINARAKNGSTADGSTSLILSEILFNVASHAEQVGRLSSLEESKSRRFLRRASESNQELRVDDGRGNTQEERRTMARVIGLLTIMKYQW